MVPIEHRPGRKPQRWRREQRVQLAGKPEVGTGGNEYLQIPQLKPRFGEENRRPRVSHRKRPPKNAPKPQLAPRKETDRREPAPRAEPIQARDQGRAIPGQRPAEGRRPGQRARRRSPSPQPRAAREQVRRAPERVQPVHEQVSWATWAGDALNRLFPQINFTDADYEDEDGDEDEWEDERDFEDYPRAWGIPRNGRFDDQRARETIRQPVAAPNRNNDALRRNVPARNPLTRLFGGRRLGRAPPPARDLGELDDEWLESLGGYEDDDRFRAMGRGVRLGPGRDVRGMDMDMGPAWFFRDAPRTHGRQALLERMINLSEGQPVRRERRGRGRRIYIDL